MRCGMGCDEVCGVRVLCVLCCVVLWCVMRAAVAVAVVAVVVVEVVVVVVVVVVMMMMMCFRWFILPASLIHAFVASLFLFLFCF